MFVYWMDGRTDKQITMEGQIRRKKQGYFKKVLGVGNRVISKAMEKKM